MDKNGTGADVNKFFTAPVLCLIGVFAVSVLCNSAYAGFEVEQGLVHYFAATFGTFFALGYWYFDDCRKYKISVPIDEGWFLFFAWFLLLPFHLVRTRGFRGFLVIGGFIAVIVIGNLLGWIIAVLIINLRH
jgi:hypothetical protein